MYFLDFMSGSLPIGPMLSVSYGNRVSVQASKHQALASYPVKWKESICIRLGVIWSLIFAGESTSFRSKTQFLINARLEGSHTFWWHDGTLWGWHWRYESQHPKGLQSFSLTVPLFGTSMLVASKRTKKFAVTSSGYFPSLERRNILPRLSCFGYTVYTWPCTTDSEIVPENVCAHCGVYALHKLRPACNVSIKAWTNSAIRRSMSLLSIFNVSSSVQVNTWLWQPWGTSGPINNVSFWYVFNNIFNFPFGWYMIWALPTWSRPQRLLCTPWCGWCSIRSLSCELVMISPSDLRSDHDFHLGYLQRRCQTMPHHLLSSSDLLSWWLLNNWC